MANRSKPFAGSIIFLLLNERSTISNKLPILSEVSFTFYSHLRLNVRSKVSLLVDFVNNFTMLWWKMFWWLMHLRFGTKLWLSASSHSQCPLALWSCTHRSTTLSTMCTGQYEPMDANNYIPLSNSPLNITPHYSRSVVKLALSYIFTKEDVISGPEQ